MGRFDGLTDAQWQVIESQLPKEPEKRGKGFPHAPWRQICNTILWVLITGSRWCDVPKGEQWGSRPGAHRWLGRWQADGTLNNILTTLIETADLAGLLNWERLAGDELFKLAIGGNGLFGVIVEATLSLTENSLLECLGEMIAPGDYLSYFNNHVLPDPQIALHYYRLSLEPGKLFQDGVAINYRESGPSETSLLQEESEKGGAFERIELQTLRRLKGLSSLAWQVEKKAALQPILASRNECMRPHIKAILSNSSIDTDWLQEYFVKPEHLSSFLVELANLLNEYRVPVLNASVRFVAANNSKSFNYAPEGPRFAVVLFFNQSLDDKSIDKTKEWICKAVNLVNSFDGSYHLPLYL